jgi:FkbM family methyltransferase
MDLKQTSGWISHVLKASTQQHHLELRPLFEPIIPKDAVIFDIGAHAGQFAKLFSKMAPQGRVYAFEPSPYALSVLRIALAVSGARNVVIEPRGLSDKPGVAVLTTPVKRRGGLGFGIAHLGDDADARASVSHEVALTTLDDFSRDLARLDFIKIDVEGWELSALKGGAETLLRFKPAIYAEVNDHHLARANTDPAQFWAFLEGIGYRATLDGEPAPAYTRAADYLWRAA